MDNTFSPFSPSASEDSFNTDINYSYHQNRLDPTTDIVSTITGGVTATVVGAAASIWNSLPLTENVETADLIGRVSDNALQVYNEHPDAINAASFIAGSFLPSGLALKTMGAMRAGVKGASWFSTAGKEADMAKAAKLFAEGAKDTRDYRNAVRGMYAKTAVNAVIDVAAMEVATLAMLNDSPLVEDYMKDPAKNFAISMALGGVLGGGLGLAADHFAVKSMAGKMSEEAINSVRERITHAGPGATLASTIQVTGQNAKNLQEMIDRATKLGKNAENDLTVSYATKLKGLYDEEVQVKLETMISPNLYKSLDVSGRQELMNKIVDGLDMAGVEKIDTLNPTILNKSILTKQPRSPLLDEPILVIPNTSKDGPVISKEVKAYYFPEFGAYGSEADLRHYAGAVDLGLSPEEMGKRLGHLFGKAPNDDAILGLQTKSAATAQSEYIGAISRVAKMKEKELASFKATTSDTVSMEAWLAKAVTEPEFAARGLKLFDNQSYGNAFKAEQASKGINSEYAFAKGGMMNQFDPRMNAVSIEAKALVHSWVNATGMQDMRLASEEYYRAGYTTSRHSQSPQAKKLEAAFKEVIESKGSVELRAKFQAEADKEGYVYLWRGTRTDRDRSNLRSYTTVPAKAGEFGTAKLYKVKVDDIIAGFHDGGHTGIQPEILVREGERVPVNLSKEGAKQLGGLITPTTQTASVAEVQKFLIEAKGTQISSLLMKGIPPQSIAIKTNTPLGLVERAQVTGKPFEELADKWVKEGKSISIINSTESIAEAMAANKQTLRLTGDQKKYSYTTAFSSRDDSFTRNINAVITEDALLSSGNPFLAELSDFLMKGNTDGGSRGMLDLIYNRLGKANNELSGNFFWQSADHAMRRMGDLGPMISYVGKQVQNIINKAVDHVNVPLADAMAIISKSATETIEFNTFREVNAGLKGWRTFKDGGLWQLAVGADGKQLFDAQGVAQLVKVTFQGKPYQVMSKSVKDAITMMEEKSPFLRGMANSARKITGSSDVEDLGLWIPSVNPTNKFIAYVHDSLTDKTSLLWANTSQEYAQLVKDYKTSLASRGIDNTTKVYEKGTDQRMWSRLNGRLDTMHMEIANTGMQKGGSSAAAVIRTDRQVFTDIAEGYTHYINSQVRKLADLSMYDITHELDTMSSINKWSIDNQPLSSIKKTVERPADAAGAVKNLLLGDTNLGEYTGWKDVNGGFETILSMASEGFTKTWEAAVQPLTKRMFGGKKSLTPDSLEKLDYETLAKELERKGIVNPWQAYDDEAARIYGLSSLSDSADSSKRIVYASNALAATLILRAGELAQPLVNIMSLPILTGLAAANKMPETFMGISKGTAKTNAISVMYDGMRASNDPQFAHLGKMWEELGYFTPMVSEANNTLKAARSQNRGLIASTEKLLDSSFVNIMSKPADYSESWARRQTMYTGAMLAKKLYPELDDKGVTIFARDFMDKAVGNFHSAQRPVVFQGTLGVALGLFQTYSLTLAQNIYKHMELKNYKAIGAAALTQSTIFGVGSMPGFAAVSNMIGEHYSDNHVDLVTGTYRAIGDEAAKIVLYGLPSLAGVGTHTRGDSNFRIPGLSGDNIIAINVAQQAATSIGTMAQSMGQGTNAAQAFLEALSLQSISRPLARTAELASGYSITRAGNTVQTPAEVWTAQGVMARVIGTRPVTEIQLREADQLNRFYGSIDRENRQAVVKKLRTAMRNSNLTDAMLASAAEKYFRKGGTPAGWRSAINQTLATTETSGREIFAEKLNPNSPINYMIARMDGNN